MSNQNQQVIPFRFKNKWGFCSGQKKIIIDPIYDYVNFFSDGLAKVIIGKKCHFIDINGIIKLSIGEDFTVRNFAEGLCAITRCKKVGSYDSNDYRTGFINKFGEDVIPMSFDSVSDFKEGVAEIKFLERDKQHWNTSFYRKNKTNFYKMIDSNISRKYDPFEPSFKNYGYIDINGKLITAFYEGIGKFSEDRACVLDSPRVGYIDKLGHEIISFENHYNYGCDFSEGVVWVGISTQKGFVFGTIDKNGKIIIPLEFKATHVYHFAESHSRFLENKKYGFIDKKGNIVIEPTYIEASDFSHGLALIKVLNKYGYIDINNNLVIDLKYDLAFDFSEGLALVCLDNKYGFIDIYGKIVIDLKYEFCSSFKDNIAEVRNSKGMGYINKNGIEFWED